VGEGACRIDGLSTSEDVEATARALGLLGVIIRRSNLQVEALKHSTRALEWEILVEGGGWDALAAPQTPIDCHNSGTTARTLMGVLAGRPFSTKLQGDKSLSRRPMQRVVAPLREMGALIDGSEGGDRLPLEVRGGNLKGIAYRAPVASAQVKTCLLLAGLQAAGETSIAEPVLSRDHTERLLEFLGVSIDKSTDRLVVKATNIRNASSLSVPGDLSSAAFLLVAAAILPGSAVTVEGVGLNPTRTGILDVLRRFGAEVSVANEREVCGEPWGDVTVKAGDRKPVVVEGDEVVRTVDELPLVGVLGAFAEGETTISDAAELRVKESDRISTLAAALTAMGASVEVRPDGMTIKGPAPLRGAAVESAGDHRIAMAMAVAALGADGETSIGDPDSAAVSYPSFWDDLDRLAER
jgi:3-phosphoshikimate 1-carboxyvinyltransferase